ncbi:Unknown protein [Striga hermonthica]|uniref:Transposase n=1 Tax=Striga hermonthica TaxID=68872 RepID=A0A9N7NIC1_STRHE|nr:Unknown protein [Striga hermonthica]
MTSNIPIDLNKTPYEVEDAVPRSSQNIIIELNVDESPEIGYPLIELDLNQFFDDDDEARSDSSGEEIIGQQAGGNSDGGNSEAGETSQGNVQRRKNRTLTDDERWAVYHALLEKSVNGSDVEVSSKKVRNCGRKRIEVDLSRIQQIEWHQRTTLTSLSNALGVSYFKLYTLFKRGVLRRHSSAIKPHLKDENKISRLEFCLSMLDESTKSNEPKFKEMYHYVHIDEKWFYLTKKEQTYYLLDSEEDPHRSCQSKNNIAKVMFLAVTARPRFDGGGRVVFSGKIGCWAFVTEQPAQRNSRNRQAGTMEMKAITSVKSVFD